MQVDEEEDLPASSLKSLSDSPGALSLLLDHSLEAWNVCSSVHMDASDFAKAQSRRRSSRLRKNLSQPESVTLGQLVSEGLLHPGDEIFFLNEVGIVTKDGWVDYDDQKYPTLESWGEKVIAYRRLLARLT